MNSFKIKKVFDHYFKIVNIWCEEYLPVGLYKKLLLEIKLLKNKNT